MKLYDIKWDKEINGIILSNNISEKEKIIPPRLVYKEELDLFGFDKYFKYERSQDPYIWAIGRNYYYKGNKIAKLAGGDIYNKPELKIYSKDTFVPIEKNKIIEKNIEAIKTIENEAKKFVNKVYKDKGDGNIIGVAFSGGKDSQAVLEIVSQVIPPSEYFAIFTDTEMELPDTYKIVETTKEVYSKKYKNFKLYTANQINPTVDNWNKFGPPSRFQRWCCTVCKTVPYLKKIFQLTEQRPLLVFEGVRRDESSSRNKYSRIAKDKKHRQLTNVRPIIDWNITEVFLYLLRKKIPLNKAYKYGLSRVGCIVCPFASKLSEYIKNYLYKENVKVFTDIIMENISGTGIKKRSKKIKYLKNGQWKKRAGGKTLPAFDSTYNIFNKQKELEINIISPKTDILEWSKILKPKTRQTSDKKYNLEVKYNDKFKKFAINFNNESIDLKYKKHYHDIVFQSILKKISFKATYCVKCGACEIECPTNAITVNPYIYVDSDKCTSCFKCLNFTDKGCLLAKSRHYNKGENIMSKKKKGIDRYSTFGLRENWLRNFFDNPSDWKNGLGVKQIPAFRRWITEAELLDKNTQITETYKILKDKNDKIMWPIIWTNLCHNSIIVHWYSNLDFGLWNRDDLEEKLFIDFPGYSEGTLKNPLRALFNTFDTSNFLSNILNLGVLSKKGRGVKSINKIGSNDVYPIALLYSIFKYAEHNEYFDLTLSEFYGSSSRLSPYKIFGVEKKYLSKMLRGLQSSHKDFIRIEFAANLDNIFVNNNYSSKDVLSTIIN